ncbi:MAG: chemotaxis protein CheW [Halobacteriales archaeon SW_9_67_25]|nr:MAG: chemotaxis protein CheW [Halobacteriales archaeon SW_9_67_25]
MPTTNGQVLEFTLGEETYCVSIDYVTEIVGPTVVFDIAAEGEGRRIIVYDPEIVEDQAAAGWLVDEVHQVVTVDEADVDESPADGDDAITGVVKRGEGEFVIWVDPAAVHAE